MFTVCFQVSKKQRNQQDKTDAMLRFYSSILSILNAIFSITAIIKRNPVEYLYLVTLLMAKKGSVTFMSKLFRKDDKKSIKIEQSKL